MQMIKLTGDVDERHQLCAMVPESIPPGKVEFFVVTSVAEEDDVDKFWMEAVAREWHAELSDPREDIYSLEDGVPVNVTP